MGPVFLHARTAEEANLFVDLECEDAGEVAKTRSRTKGRRRSIEFVNYEIRCESGRLMEFEFEHLPAPRPGLGRSVRFGDATPSLLIDAGDWLRVADRHAAEAATAVSGLSEQARRDTAHHLKFSIACLDEVYKFLTPGETRIGEEHLFTDRGRANFYKDIRRFEKSELDALRTSLSARLRRCTR